jgi:hypothetical protein
VDCQGSNITRQERARLHTDLEPLEDYSIEEAKKLVDRDAHRSCRDYLKMLDEDPTFAHQTH